MERERADRLIREWFARALAAVDPAVAVDRAVDEMWHSPDGPVDRDGRIDGSERPREPLADQPIGPLSLHRRR